MSLLVLLLAGLSGVDRRYPPASLTLDYSTRVFDRNGELLWRFASPVTGVYRYQWPADQIPVHYQDAVLAFEDRWFYYHPGVNPVALLRGFWQWVRYGEIVSGGSTLTMQLARMLEGIPRTVPGKLQQILRALQYEWHYSKREILKAYIDKVPMGGGVEGVEAAAQHYFASPAAALTLSQSLILAGIPQNPERLRPDQYPQQALQQRNKLLQRYASVRALSATQIAQIRAEPVVLINELNPQAAYWTAEALRQQYPNRTELISTVDLVLQQNLRATLQRIDLKGDDAVAALVLENASGKVRARAGNRARLMHGDTAWLDLSTAVRSPGSTLKPFLYAQALARRLIHSESLLSDVPRSFGGYRPGNFNRRYHGAVSVSEALQHSLNVPAVALMNKLGVDPFSQLLAAAGLHQSHTTANLSLVLGGTGTTLLDLVGAYRALAVAGERVHPIESKLDKARSHQWLDPSAAWIVAETLSQVSPPSGYRSRRKTAWKTGTSWGGRDAWAIGVTADFTVGIWIGSVRGAGNVNRSGYQHAGALLFDAISLLPPDRQPWPVPSRVASRQICWPGGRDASNVSPSRCWQQRRAWIIDGTTPATLDAGTDQWPDVLLQWQRDTRIAGRWQGAPRIVTIQENQHIGAPLTAIPLQATSHGDVDWYLDGSYLPSGQLKPSITAGSHQLTAVDNKGRSAKIQFVVQ